MSNIHIDKGSFGNWLKNHRQSLEWTIEELAEKANLSTRTLKRIEKQTASGEFWETTLLKIAKAFQLTLPEVLKAISESEDASSASQKRTLTGISSSEIVSPWDNFSELATTILDIDRFLLNTVRRLTSAPSQMLHRAYATELQGSLSDYEISIDALTELLKDTEFLSSILQTVPTPTMSVKMEKYLKSVTFGFENSTFLAHNPSLLWDCHCKTPTLKKFEIDPIRYKAKDCPIHRCEHGKEIEDRFKNSLIEIQFDELGFLWKRSEEFWPPSMDTFTMLLDLEKASVFNHLYSKVIDIGCGTGILGISLARRNPQVTHVAFSDWLLTPLFYTAMNWVRNIPNPTKRAFYPLLGLNNKWVNKSEVTNFQLAICNPPYLPVPAQFKNINISSTVAGTELLERFIENSSTIANDSYVSFSHLAKPEADASAKRSRKRLQPIAESRLVPFRMPQVFGHLRYINWLIKHRGLIYEPRLRHRMWHYLTTYKIEPL
jgi:transcriptional regulator with XRE-family HTH domain/SAM-dependent methyltransferase